LQLNNQKIKPRENEVPTTNRNYLHKKGKQED
jgi:homoaconitase/3-isopropylmalate dehydratase large subunit